PLSPSYGRETAYVAVHVYHERDPSDVFRDAERVFRRYDGRPHWGKMHSMRARDLRPLYPRWGDYLDLRGEMDPDGVMLNDHLRSVFGVG
ncbi:MAG: D-arabinono-1,4-lactone oxidase, partial [Halobacteriales archaeon]